MASDYKSWTEDWEALCVTVTRLAAPDAAQCIALAGFAEFPDLESAKRWVSGSEDYDRAWFATGEIDGWTFVWEDNGWQGVTPEAALRLADTGPLVSMFWNVNAQMTFLAIDDGAIVRQFDPLFHDDEEPPTEVIGLAAKAEAGLDWQEAPRMSGLALLSSTSGVRAVDPGWLAEPGVRYWAHRF